MTHSREPIRIYFACLAAYNNGILHGAWIEADQAADAMMKDIKAMLDRSPIPEAGEYALHDYEGFYGINLSEWSSLEEIAELSAFIEEHGALGAALHSHYNCLDDARSALEDHYAGAYESAAAFAQDLTEQTTSIPDALQYYIDYEAMGRDMLINDVLEIRLDNGELHLFWQH